MFLRRKFSPGFSRAVNRLLRSLPGIRHATGRIVNVSYRPTQNGCWVSTHEDITERAQNEARIAHLARGATGSVHHLFF
jgi:hypothetical protein